MARNTRLATTVTARYTPSVGAVDSFYLDGRIAGRREEQFADITLDREDRGSFFAVYASSHGNRSETHNDDGNRQALDQIANDLKKNNRRNIDYEINELAECVVNVAGRLTLADTAIRQPYFSGIIIKDGEMAAITLGRGCAYLYRDETLYPLTQDEYALEPIDGNGRKVSNLNDFSAGIAGTIRYSNIAQLKQDDCIIMCNKEVMEAIGQRQMLRILDVAEDQCEAAGMVLDLASTENPHTSMQFMIGFVEDISTVDRLGRATLAKGFTARTTDRTGNKNNNALFADFEDPYKAPVPSPVTASANNPDYDMADTKPGLDLNEAAKLAALAESASFEKMQANSAIPDKRDSTSASNTDFYQDLTGNDAIDYNGFDDESADSSPLYAAETSEQFSSDQPLYSDENWGEGPTLAYSGGYRDSDRNKKIAVIALAIVAVILLFFIIKTLVSGEEPGDSSLSTPQIIPSSSTVNDTKESTLATEESSSSDNLTSETSTDTVESSTDSTSEGNESTEETTTTVATSESTTAPTTAATTASTTTAPTTAPSTTETTTAPTTATPTTTEVQATYVVQEGDTIYFIALKIYNDPAYMSLIGELNGFDPENVYIEAGQVLKLPAPTE